MSNSAPAIDGRVRVLIDASSDAVLIVCAEGVILELNPSALAMFGYTRGEMIGLDWDLLVAGDASPFFEALEHSGPTREDAKTSRLRRKDGTVFAGEVSRMLVDEDASWHWVVIRDLSDRVRAGRALNELRDSNEVLRALTDAAFEAVVMHSEGVIRMANRAAELYAGVEPGQLIGRRLSEFIAPQSLEMILAKIASGDDQPYEAYGRRADGTVYPVEVHPRTTPVELGRGVLRVATMRDMSTRRELEEQLRQAQKLEAIGRLAGGVAHDFNNLLSIVVNAAELASVHLADDHPSRAELDEILAAAERAALLTRQLLAFGRRAELRPRVIDASVILEGMRSMLRRLLRDEHELELVTPGPAWLRVDPVQLEQVVLNLVINAGDALLEGGRVSVEVDTVTLDPEFARAHVGVEAGEHVKIVVSDTGVGMSAETRERIFEPFFTTKPSSDSHALGGTGLGLATVFGIVKQSGGTIWVESEPGLGATFTIYLPAVEAPPAS